MCPNFRRSAKIFIPAHLALTTMPQLKSQRSHFSQFWCLMWTLAEALDFNWKKKNQLSFYLSSTAQFSLCPWCLLLADTKVFICILRSWSLEPHVWSQAVRNLEQINKAFLQLMHVLSLAWHIRNYKDISYISQRT